YQQRDWRNGLVVAGGQPGCVERRHLAPARRTDPAAHLWCGNRLPFLIRAPSHGACHPPVQGPERHRMQTAVPLSPEVETLPQPYLLFLGDITEPGYAKTAFGL